MNLELPEGFFSWGGSNHEKPFVSVMEQDITTTNLNSIKIQRENARPLNEAIVKILLKLNKLATRNVGKIIIIIIYIYKFRQG